MPTTDDMNKYEEHHAMDDGTFHDRGFRTNWSHFLIFVVVPIISCICLGIVIWYWLVSTGGLP